MIADEFRNQVQRLLLHVMHTGDHLQSPDDQGSNAFFIRLRRVDRNIKLGLPFLQNWIVTWLFLSPAECELSNWELFNSGWRHYRGLILIPFDYIELKLMRRVAGISKADRKL